MLNLRLLRVSKGLSQAQAARMLGISSSKLCQWEKGFRRPTVNDLRMLSEKYNVTIDFLLDRNVEKDINPELEKKLSAVLAKVPRVKTDLITNVKEFVDKIIERQTEEENK